jgi:alkyldihydroxyacetonephosphate synthase
MALLRGGRTVYGQALGILMLDTRFPRPPGDVGNANTWPFPTQYRIVKGADTSRIMGEERLFGRGVIVDTMEIAGLWSGLERLYASVRRVLAEHASQAVGCHLSHPYRSGASLYFTFLIHADDDQAAERRYLACWEQAAGACDGAGGTITHHHGVGLLKAAFLERELGPEGVSALRSIKRALDPSGILNPGKVLPGEGEG